MVEFISTKVHLSNRPLTLGEKMSEIEINGNETRDLIVDASDATFISEVIFKLLFPAF